MPILLQKTGMSPDSNIKEGLRFTFAGTDSEEISFQFHQLGIVPGDRMIIREISAWGDPVLIEVEGKIRFMMDKESARFLEMKEPND
jgi:Fe2+ transport system protein FeoA